MRSLIPASTPVTIAAFDRIENSADVAGDLLDPLRMFRYSGTMFFHPGIVLFHAGKDLADVIPVLRNLTLVFFTLPTVLLKLIHLAGNDLSQVADDRGHGPDLPAQVINPLSHLGEPDPHLGKLKAHFSKSRSGPFHVISQNLRESLQGQ